MSKSKLYEEAIADSKKLKDLLREDAQKELMKNFKPLIEEALSKEISSFLLEQDEEMPEAATDNATPDFSSEEPAAASPEEPVAAEPPMPAEPNMGSPTVPPVDASVEAPIKPVGGNMNMPLPGADGMVVVSFADLFAGDAQVAAPEAAPVPPATPPTPPTPPATPTDQESTEPQTPEAEPAAGDLGLDLGSESPAQDTSQLNPEKIQEAKTVVGNLEEEFVSYISEGKFSIKEKTNFTFKLLETYASLEVLKETKQIRNSLFQVLTYRMENLHKLSQNSEKLVSSYSGIQKITEGKTSTMKKVHPKTKEMINSLLESLETGFGSDAETKKVSSQPLNSLETVANKAGEAAKKASKPKLEDPERGGQAPFKHKAKEDESLLKEEQEGLDEEMAALEKELDEMLSGEEEVEEREPVMESAAKKKDLKAKAAKAEEAKKKDLKAKAKRLKEQLAEVQAEMDECGSDMSMPGKGASTTITITTDGEIDTMPGAKVSTGLGLDDDGDEDLEGLDGEEDEDVLQTSSMDEEDMFEIVMDTEEDEDMDEGWDMDEAKSPEVDPSSLNESLKRKLVKENKALKTEMGSTQHLLARSILANKIYADYDLTREQKKLVVEYLDKASTVNDAKRIYGRIKKQLNESKANATANSNSKSANVKQGSLNESVSRRSNVNQNSTQAERIVIGSAERFKQLAGGKKNG
jgi:hypothetical protein